MTQAMRWMACSAAVAGAVVWASGRQASAQPDGGSGRYQLVNAEYTVTSEGGGARSVRGLFKLDTQTGRVWRYTEHVRKDGEARSNWIPAGERD